MRCLVTGGAGFIGSHLVDRLIEQGHEVLVLDNLRSGYESQINRKAEFVQLDIRNYLYCLGGAFDVIFHLAAIARTPWCMDDPVLAAETNVMGTVRVLEYARQWKTPRVVCASSNVVYAARTPYRATKEMVEMWCRTYQESYGVNAVSLRFSNVYGPRQSEEGPSPNVFAAFRKCYREKGYVEITGDGEQSRDFTHVDDIVDGLIKAWGTKNSCPQGIDLCTGVNWTMNHIVKNFFKAPVRYLPERAGDVKHIRQSPVMASTYLGWRYVVDLDLGIEDVL